MALFTQYAICAAKQALFDAEWISISDDDKEKTVMFTQINIFCI